MSDIPKMPEPSGWMYEYVSDGMDCVDMHYYRFKESWVAKKQATETPLYTLAQLREQVMGCVPDRKSASPGDEVGLMFTGGHNACRAETLANLQARFGEMK